MFDYPWLNIVYVVVILVVGYRIVFGGDYFDGDGPHGGVA